MFLLKGNHGQKDKKKKTIEMAVNTLTNTNIVFHRKIKKLTKTTSATSALTTITIVNMNKIANSVMM